MAALTATAELSGGTSQPLELRFPGGAERLDWDPSGRVVAVANNDGSVAVLDVANNLLWRADVHENVCYVVAWHPTLPILASAGGDGQIVLSSFDDTGIHVSERYRVAGAYSIWDLAWRKNDLLAVGFGVLTHLELNGRHLSERWTHALGRDYDLKASYGVTWTSEHTCIAVGSAIHFCDLADKKAPREVQFGGDSSVLRYVTNTQSGRVLAVGILTGKPHIAEIYSAGSRELRTESALPSAWTLDLVDRNGVGYLLLPGADGKLYVLRDDGATTSGGSRPSLRTAFCLSGTGDPDRPCPLYGARFSPDGRSIAATSSDGSLGVFDWSKPEESPTLSSRTSVSTGVWTSVAWRPTPTAADPATNPVAMASAAVATSSGMILMISADGGLLHGVSAHMDWADDLAWTDDGLRLLSHGHDGWCKLWQLDGQSRLQCVWSQSGILSPPALSPDGTFIVEIRHEISFYPTNSPPEVKTDALVGFKDSYFTVRPIVYRPHNGPGVVVGARGNTVVFWEFGDAGSHGIESDEKGSLGFSDSVRALWLMDDHLLAVGCDDGTLEIIAVSWEEPRESGRTAQFALGSSVQTICSRQIPAGVHLTAGCNSGSLFAVAVGSDGRSLHPRIEAYKPQRPRWCRTLSWAPDGQTLLAGFNGYGLLVTAPQSLPGESAVAPFVPDVPAYDDHLGREPLISALANYFESSLEASSRSSEGGRVSAGISILLNGTWGSGKSSVVRMLRPRLQETGWICVSVNAWHYEQAGLTWWAIVSDLSREVLHSLPRVRRARARVALARKEVPARLIWLGVGVLTVGYLAVLIATKSIADLGQALQGVGTVVLGVAAAAAFNIAAVFRPRHRSRRFRSERPESLEEIAEYLAHIRSWARPNRKVPPVASTRQETTVYPKQPSKRPAPAVRVMALAKRVARRSVPAQSHTPVVLLIDDLDRCRPKFAVEFLNALHALASIDEDRDAAHNTDADGHFGAAHSVLSAPPFHYLVSADKLWLARAYHSVLAEDADHVVVSEPDPLEWEFGFLSKVFLAEVRLPLPDDERAREYAESVATLSGWGATRVGA